MRKLREIYKGWVIYLVRFKLNFTLSMPMSFCFFIKFSIISPLDEMNWFTLKLHWSILKIYFTQLGRNNPKMSFKIRSHRCINSAVRTRAEWKTFFFIFLSPVLWNVAPKLQKLWKKISFWGRILQMTHKGQRLG